MKIAVCLCLVAACVVAEQAVREAVYVGALNVGGQVVPLFANGYLIYLHQPKRLQVVRRDTQLAFEYDVPCPPQTTNCSVAGVAVSRDGIVALGMGFLSPDGFASGIRMVDQAGKELKFINTGRYVPQQLAFDGQGNLWSMGWKRDQSITDAETKDDYGIMHKYSGQGGLLGEYLPRSLWGTKHSPSLGGRGYWTMYAADDRVGALLNENFAGATGLSQTDAHSRACLFAHSTLKRSPAAH